MTVQVIELTNPKVAAIRAKLEAAKRIADLQQRPATIILQDFPQMEETVLKSFDRDLLDEDEYTPMPFLRASTGELVFFNLDWFLVINIGFVENSRILWITKEQGEISVVMEGSHISFRNITQIQAASQMKSDTMIQ